MMREREREREREADDIFYNWVYKRSRSWVLLSALPSRTLDHSISLRTLSYKFEWLWILDFLFE